MSRSGRQASIKRDFPGDEALQQIHLARKSLLAAARKKRLTLGEYVRSLNLQPKNPSRS